MRVDERLQQRLGRFAVQAGERAHRRHVDLASREAPEQPQQSPPAVVEAAGGGTQRTGEPTVSEVEFVEQPPAVADPVG
ncbi:hypothetical protein [Phytomonospora endophytica]|uniref:Uncharacterized protein n=1 Tax=Phytomonospora endophytica TaxID=714109 RepID=A0A841FW99_9ACTN|nr:hypothetical protein [Phytomonospora endophytica]MBB6037607.1 hypothetical protein [Phytomonospora endophytica]GIG67868.1 hypothetical protein Pen01_41630 [Phytomonospora endophytica]